MEYINSFCLGFLFKHGTTQIVYATDDDHSLNDNKKTSIYAKIYNERKYGI